MRACVCRTGDEIVTSAPRCPPVLTRPGFLCRAVESAARACRVAPRRIECAPAGSSPPGGAEGCPGRGRRAARRRTHRSRVRRAAARARGRNPDRRGRRRRAERARGRGEARAAVRANRGEAGRLLDGRELVLLCGRPARRAAELASGSLGGRSRERRFRPDQRIPPAAHALLRRGSAPARSPSPMPRSGTPSTRWPPRSTSSLGTPAWRDTACGSRSSASASGGASIVPRPPSSSSRELAALDRPSGATALPVRTVTPPVTAAMLSSAARTARIAVSAPVSLRSTTRSWRLPRRPDRVVAPAPERRRNATADRRPRCGLLLPAAVATRGAASRRRPLRDGGRIDHRRPGASTASSSTSP